jgi:hypothetical protein
MRFILILSVLILLFLPVLAVEPVYVGGTFGKSWLNNSANKNPGLWTWGSMPYSSYYLGLPTIGYPLAGYRKGLVNPYGEWIPYTLYMPTDFYTSATFNPYLWPGSFYVTPPFL